MKNYIQPGDTLTVAAPTGGVASGDLVLVGAFFGVAATTAAEAAAVEIKTCGVFELPKATGESWAVGDLLYWDAANKKLTKTVGDNLQVAAAAAAADTADTTGIAKLNDGGPRLAGALAPETAIADLAAITGGESPTEAEHNAVITALNAVLAALRAKNILED